MFELDYMIAAMVLSAVGLGLMMYGKKQPEVSAGAAGVLLMAIPCVVFTPWIIWVLGVATVGTWQVVRRVAEV